MSSNEHPDMSGNPADLPESDDPVFCPICLSTSIVAVAEWEAKSLETAGTENRIQEWQCADCARSFWV